MIQERYKTLYDESRDMLRIQPTDYEAQMAFHQTVLKRGSGDLNPHHSQLIAIWKGMLVAGRKGCDSATTDERVALAK